VQQVAAAKGSYTGEWLRKLAEVEKAFPHARQPRAKAGKAAEASQAVSPGPGAKGQGPDAEASGNGSRSAEAGAPEIPEVFRRKPAAEDEQPKRRGRPPKTVRV
jgi:hypothetical protein